MKKTYLFSRKINKQEYKFYHMDCPKEESWTGVPYGCFMVETPENAFGYPDYVYFSEGKESTMHRPLANYITKKLRSYLEKQGYNPDSSYCMKF